MSQSATLPTTCREMVVEGISVPLGTDVGQVLYKARQKVKRSGLPAGSLHFRLYKKSIDARKKQDIRLVYSVICTVKTGERDLSTDLVKRAGYKPYLPGEVAPVHGSTPLCGRPLVVGAGPAGLFCAYLLAREGYAPILIERGDDIAERVDAVDAFVRDGVLDTESNIQFGAGGAGTFSDGKLLTRINDSRCAFVLETLKDMGAPNEITTQAKPHVGTDMLRRVVSHMLTRIVDMGGEVVFRCRFEGVSRLADGTFSAHTTKGDMPCGVVVLAPGHSARDTYHTLIKENFAVEAKPISVGVRIEHLREDMDQMLYGHAAGHPDLGAGEYHLSDTKGERGVYTFCMCPGGEVVAAASEEDSVVVNGMSNHARDGVNSNAAIAVSVGVEDYTPVDGNMALGAIAFQRKIERAAFVAGGKNYDVPLETVGDFLSGKGQRGMTSPSRVQPTYRGGTHYRTAPMSDVLPPFVVASLMYGIASFDKKIAGYAMPEAVLTAAETRTSAPVRILRGQDFCALGHEGIYPCGEGAGYAGGITSAATDGLRVAEAIVEKYREPALG